MSKVPDSEFTPDLSKVNFPSDRITVKDMRRAQPSLLFSDRELLRFDRQLMHIEAIDTARVEHILARKAWAKALDLPDPHASHERLDLISFLDEGYQRYGISSGPKATLELVRQFESEAAQEAARTAGGRPR